MSKKKTLKKYRIKYGLEKGTKKKKKKRYTIYNQFNSKDKNPNRRMDIDTLDNGISDTYWYDVLLKKNSK